MKPAAFRPSRPRVAPPAPAPRRGYKVTNAPVFASILVSVLAAMMTLACEKRTTGRDLTSKPATPAAAPETKRYGAPLAAAEPVPIGDVLAKPEAFTNRTVTVEGHVRKACTRKGCWMELGGRDQNTPGARITFKDYGFFVPTDSAGAEARVQGNVQLDTLSAAAVRHYEEEGAVFPSKKPDGTAPEVRLVASGVEMWRSTKN
ncbi:MAG TPA: DUF4920 domain-containing protein [Polyangia bacterium]